MNQANLFPAFEGPEHENLHTKGRNCICKPLFRVRDHGGEDVTHFRHRPLTEKNKANPPTWLVEAEDEGWESASELLI